MIVVSVAMFLEIRNMRDALGYYQYIIFKY